MHTPKVDIERPGWLALLLALTVAGLGWAQGSLAHLAKVQADAPVLIVHEREDLAAALRAAPFAGQSADDGSPLGDPVWLIGHVGCAGCDEATAGALDRLDQAGLEAHILFVPDAYPAPPSAAELVAVVARTGDAGHFRAWREGRALPPLVSDPAEAEGYSELARQAAQRVTAALAANGLHEPLPVVIWRVNGIWRALPAGRPAATAAVRRDLRS